MRRIRWQVAALALGLAGVCTSSTFAGQAIDAKEDFIPSYHGVRAPSLDVISVSAEFDDQFFTLRGTMAGPIVSTSGYLYVWGANTGTGTAGFASIGETGVLFNRVIVVRANGTATLSGNALPVTVDGATISVKINKSLLASTGFAFRDYTFNLWPRDNFNAISDFAPDNSNIGVAPEPSTLASAALAAIGGIVVARRRRRGA